jgi:hypothetical protein
MNNGVHGRIFGVAHRISGSGPGEVLQGDAIRGGRPGARARCVRARQTLHSDAGACVITHRGKD